MMPVMFLFVLGALGIAPVAQAQPPAVANSPCLIVSPLELSGWIGYRVKSPVMTVGIVMTACAYEVVHPGEDGPYGTRRIDLSGSRRRCAMSVSTGA